MARTHKRTERLVADYLGCLPDPYGSRRDWMEPWDLSVLGNDGRRWYLEVKSHQWMPGTKQLRTFLQAAWKQLTLACAKARVQGPRAVVYRPTRTQGSPPEANMLVYCQLAGEMVVMFADDFKARFIEREESHERQDGQAGYSLTPPAPREAEAGRQGC